LAAIWLGQIHAQGVIATYAGGNRTFTGDGQSATALFLSKVSSVSLDSAGNPIIALEYRNVVLRVNADGSMTRLAGTGDTGSFGNGLKATSAGLNAPLGAAYDSAGNLYIADNSNSRIQKVSQDGTISTFAGTGVAGFGGDNGPALQAQLNFPTDVRVDLANNVFINDQANNRIRKVTPQGIISTVLGDGGSTPFQAGQPGTKTSLVSPGLAGIGLDSAGNLYVADFGGNRVIEVDAKTGLVSNIAGTGTPGSARENVPAAAAALNNPSGVAVDNAGSIYISDTNNFKIRKITGGLISTYAGNGQFGFAGDGGPAKSANFRGAFGLAVDLQGNLFLADRDNFRVRRVDAATQTISTVAGNGTSFDNGVPAAGLLLFKPAGVNFAPDGSLIIADTLSDIVRRVSPAGIAFTVAGTGGDGFSGDGGLATSAELSFPFGSAFDSQGNLYIADQDNNRIRKIDASGVIATVAGTDTQGYNQDGILAMQAQLNQPRSVAFDSYGNLYIADFGNNRIRRVSGGVITTVAQLQNPSAIAFDGRGNLLIADPDNGLVHSMSPNGTLTTIAGGGPNLFPASNGRPATSAALGAVSGVAVDSAGNIYFSDAGNSAVQKITPNGTLVLVAGNGKSGFSASDDGGNATLAQLNDPRQIAFDQAGNLFIADFGNDRIRVVYATPPTFSAAPNPLGFTAASGGLPVSQSLNLASGVAGMAYTASVAPGASWLSVSSASGQTPAAIAVTADPSQLQPGSYNGAVTVTAPLASPAAQSITVTFLVGAAQPSKLSTDATALSFSFAKQGAPSTRSVRIANAGGSTLAFAIKAKTDDGGSWLRVSSTSGSATPAQSFSLTVTADPATLSPGTYTGSVILTNSSVTTDSLSIAVSVTVSNVLQTMVLSDTGLTFTAVQDGGAVPAQSFEVVNNGAGTMNWTLTAAPLDSGLSWISVNPTQGSSTGGVTPSPIGVQVNAAGLAPGTYYGQITVTSPTAQNSPQLLTVVLNVLPPNSDPGPVVLPSGLIFTGAAGGQNPPAQTVTVTNLSATPLLMGSSRTYVPPAANWFAHDTINATILPSFPLTITVTPQIAGLLPGVYQGVLTLAFSDNTVRTIAIRLILAPSGSSTSESSRQQTAAACTPTTLVPLFTTLGNGFSLPATWPQQIVVRVVDDCGVPLTSGSVVVSFSDGDSDLPLTPLEDGRWSKTWSPVHNAATNVLTATAQNAAQTLKATTTAAGGIQNNAAAPLLTAEGVISVTNGSPGAPLAPGEFISIYGAQLAPVTSTAQALPFETSLQGVKVVVAGKPVPVQYVSGGQINAILPYDVPSNGTIPLVVQNSNQLSPVVQVPIADSLPTVFYSIDQNGNPQGAVTDPNGVVYSPSHPASVGSGAVIYCVGLGAVDTSVPVGTASPGNPLAKATGAVSVTIGGQPVQQVIFQGLTPTYAGLYQINVVIPPGVPSGNAVPVNVSVGGRAGNPVTIAIK